VWFAVTLFSANFLYAARSGAQDQPEEQDVAATAHKEKARTSSEAKPQSHVYTNDDLQKPQILTEQDRARVEARKNSLQPPETAEPRPSLDANGDSSAKSLGEVARLYRREKVADSAEEASLPKPPAPFPMDLSQPIFATPAPIGPLSVSRIPLVRIEPPAATSKPRLGRTPLKRDPFSRPALFSFSSARNPGQTPLINDPAEPSPVAPPSEPPAAGPAKPSIASPPPAVRGMAPARHSMVSPAASPRPLVPPTSSVAPTAGRDSSITVHPGDSLWKIALAHYGNGAEWQCIAGANPALSDPGQIYPGQTLVLPARCSLSQTSR
jgi:nucleoid-associated protein YgaU